MAYGKRPGSRKYLMLGSALGDFIVKQTPYPQPRPFRISTAAGMKVYGPGKKFTKAHPFKIADVRAAKSPKVRKVRRLSPVAVRRILRQGLFWEIGGAKRRMSKVVRIPYLYYDPVLGKVARTALVVAWEGGGGGC